MIYLPDNLAYDYVLKDVLGNTIWTRDGVSSPIQSLSTQVEALPTSAGASGIGFLEPGTGAVLRTVQGRLQETVSVLDFMTDVQRADVQTRAATLDVAGAFNAAVTYLGTVGGGIIRVPAGTYKISSTITVSSNGIVFQGAGFDTYHDTGSSVHPTRITWGGANTDSMFVFTSISGASNKCITGCGFLDIALDGTNSGTWAKCLVELRSHRGGNFRFYGTGATDWLLKLTCVDSLGEAEDTQYNVIELWGRQFSSGGGGMYLGGAASTSQNANTSFNQIRMVDIQVSTGVGIQFANSDTNFIAMARVIGITTGYAYQFLGSSASVDRTARGNFINLISSQGQSIAYGTTTYTYPSHSNYVGLDTGNATPAPTIETGASCYYGSSGGYVRFKSAAARLALSDSTSGAETQRDSLTTETLRIHNASANHVRFTDGTNEWALTMVGGDIMFNRITGTGLLRIGGWTTSGDTAVNGYITVKDNNGVSRKVATIA